VTIPRFSGVALLRHVHEDYMAVNGNQVTDEFRSFLKRLEADCIHTTGSTMPCASTRLSERADRSQGAGISLQLHRTMQSNRLC